MLSLCHFNNYFSLDGDLVSFLPLAENITSSVSRFFFSFFIITNNATLTNSVPISFSICIIISVEWSYRSEMAES